MFTGIIEETGNVGRLAMTGRSGRITIYAKKVLDGTGIGDSIAVNGICLTVTDLTDRSFTADVMPETVRRSSLSSLRAGSAVNLERAMAAGGRFGGHFVTGHIDGTGVITSMLREENAVRVGVRCGGELVRLICEKGSIAIDGISLTVAGVSDDGFMVSVIPHTGGETTLLQKKSGDPVNLETDILARYTDRLLSFGSSGRGAVHQTFAGAGQSAGNDVPDSRRKDSSAHSGLTIGDLERLGF